MFPNEVTVGPLRFEYDVDNEWVTVKLANVRTAEFSLSSEDWLAFYALASTPGAQGAPV